MKGRFLCPISPCDTESLPKGIRDTIIRFSEPCSRQPTCPRRPGLQREVIKRRCAAPPHGSFTPAAVLTEPPPLCEAMAGREYHCHSDCHRHTGGNPILAEEFLAGPGKPGSWRTLLLWLALSRVGTDVLDEWVSSCQGALREYPSTPYYNIRGPKANFFHVTFRKNFSGISCSRAKYGKSTAGHMPRRAPYNPL